MMVNDGEQYHITRVNVVDKDSYIAAKDSYMTAINESDVLRLAEEIEAKAETLKNSASILRRAIFEK
jgi:hypothetical protein